MPQSAKKAPSFLGTLKPTNSLNSVYLGAVSATGVAATIFAWVALPFLAAGFVWVAVSFDVAAGIAAAGAAVAVTVWTNLAAANAHFDRDFFVACVIPVASTLAFNAASNPLSIADAARFIPCATGEKASGVG